MTATVESTALPLRLIARGKVRDVYEVDADRLLLVATDRISAFDIVMREPIPRKGAVLTQLTAWWLGRVTSVRHHMISADTSEIIGQLPLLAPWRAALAGRAMLVWRASVYPVECVVRGYISGSGWKEYKQSGTLAEEPLPGGLQESARLDEPRFTPATKATSGHDENISRTAAQKELGPVADTLERASLELYAMGSAAAESSGLILADTKFEFGERDGEVILIDEVMTPDSSRLWAADSYTPGSTPPSFDKQPLRDYLQSLRARNAWDGEYPPPSLPAEVITATSARYLEAFRLLTGSPLPEFDA